MTLNYCALSPVGNAILGEAPVGGVTISASVGANGANKSADTTKIQHLLNLCGASPPLAEDGIVGPKTIAAIKAFQLEQHLGVSDGRVDPHERTLGRLNVLTAAQAQTPPAPVPILAGGGNRLGVVGAPAAPAAPTPPPAPRMTPLQAAVDASPTAYAWTMGAIMHLGMLQLAHTLAGGMNSRFDILNTHFHFDRLADSSMVPFHIGTLQIVFERIRQTIAFSDKHYREDAATPESRFADAPMGGFDFPDPTNRITFRTEYPDCGPMCRAAMIVHEGAHLCGKLNEINHFAHEFPLPNGKPQGAGHTRNYAQLLPEEAMKNASSYAAFAIHVTTGTDSRFGLDKQKV